ncbi:MAG: PorT family protein [Bacteroidota bacterium]|nr:PorT family protein [Bacteroidota bacterium]
MPFDKLDKKVQEAADHYTSAYSENSWNKMEALLDEHMPPNNEVKRKLPLAWIFMLLILATVGALLLLMYPAGKRERGNQAAMIEKIIPATRDNNNNNSNSKKSVAIQVNKNTGPKKAAPSANLNQRALSSANTFSKAIKKNSSIANQVFVQPAYDRPATELNNIIEPANHDGALIASDYTPQIIDDLNMGTGKLSAKNISPKGSISQDNSAPVVTEKVKPGIKNKFSDLFSLNFSAGPDVSAVNINNIGTFKLLYGAGIGYSFAKKWEVRAGIYAVKKVYEAASSDYHPPTFFWNYYPNLEDVNADCKVIEVPLIVNYKFSQHAKHEWFASAGMSSYFMKKETYIYHSKIAPGQYQDKSYTVQNQNNHYLSSLRLSAGYEKNVSKTVSFSAEPYLTLPLSGVGFGKVKLNSAGLLFSVSVKPFVKNK